MIRTGNGFLYVRRGEASAGKHEESLNGKAKKKPWKLIIL
jgi:hypothetical protein